jgi:hypothetical protein
MKNDLKDKLLVPEVKLIELSQDREKLFLFFKDEIRVPKIFNELSENIEYFLKPKKEFYFLSNGYNLEKDLIIEKLFYPEINVTVFVKKGEVVKKFFYQVLERKENSKPERFYLKDVELKEKISLIIEKINLKFNSKGNYIYNIDFLFSKDGELVLSEINMGRLPAGLGDFEDIKGNLNFLLNNLI